MIKTMSCVLGLLSIAACKGEEAGGAMLDDADLADLRIEPAELDPTATRILALAEVVPPGTPVTTLDVATGSVAQAAASDVGGFDIIVPSAALDDVYSLQAGEDPEPLVVALSDSGSVVRAWGEGWSSEIGCELHEWAGIIGTDAASPPIDRCRLEALRQDDGAGVLGEIEPVGITADTVLRARSLVRLVDETAPRVEVILAEVDGTEHALEWIAGAVDVFEDHSSILALDVPSAIGASIAAIAIRSSGESGLLVSDVALVGIEAARQTGR
ncbi:MAG: hypothetical protein HYY06_10930 [Deltaproteobacteria bacterium]|nr:hypothetical protein [Deltaproteobacteria bacterium]